MLGITMRICRKEYPNGNVEWRDCLANSWPHFLDRLLPSTPWVMLPNMGADIITYIEKLGVNSLIFSGGEDWGLFPARDKTEQTLFGWATGKPILGICRGAQIINQLLGGAVSPVANHVACKHKIWLDKEISGVKDCIIVNSYHNLGIKPENLAPGLVPFAWSPEGCIEGFISQDGNISGIMWHPEREGANAGIDAFLLRHLTKRKGNED